VHIVPTRVGVKRSPPLPFTLPHHAHKISCHAGSSATHGSGVVCRRLGRRRKGGSGGWKGRKSALCGARHTTARGHGRGLHSLPYLRCSLQHSEIDHSSQNEYSSANRYRTRPARTIASCKCSHTAFARRLRATPVRERRRCLMKSREHELFVSPVHNPFCSSFID
jgi:hypothetical protein